jgi:murein DD-endopeptidase MepM/ murein hydrolase activator NlpD
MASVPAPLVTARVSGYDFGAPMPAGGWTGTGQSFGWLRHLGSDIGTPAGSPIVAAEASTLSYQTGLPGYGNLLTEKFANGWSFLFGHVAAGSSGQAQAGQQIGVTGKDVGSSQGAVTLFQVKNPQGVDVNPDPILQALVGGKVQLYGAQSSSLVPPGPVGTGLAIVNPIGTIAAGLGLTAGQAAATGASPSDPFGITAAGNALGSSINAIPTSIGHGLADFFVVAEQDIADWLKRQAVAFFVAAVVLLVLFAR